MLSRLAVAVVLALPLAAQSFPVAYGIRTIAGMYPIGDGGPAVDALLSSPGFVVSDTTGNVFIADTLHGRVRRVSTEGTITSATGGLTQPPWNYRVLDGDHRTMFVLPAVLALSPSGVFLISDGYIIWRLAENGVLIRVAGATNSGNSADGVSAVGANLNGVRGIVRARDGMVYFTEADGHKIRQVDGQGKLGTLAGTGTAGMAGDGGPAAQAQLNRPEGLAIDTDGSVLVADRSALAIRRITSQGTIETIAGARSGTNYADGPALQVRLQQPALLSRGPDGLIYFQDGVVIRRLTADKSRIETVAGARPGVVPVPPNAPPALKKEFESITGFTVVPSGDIVISEGSQDRAWIVRGNGNVERFAGAAHYRGDGGPATEALLYRPWSIAKDAAGNLYINDNGNARLRKVDAAGQISTLLAQPAGTSLNPSRDFISTMGLAAQPDGALFAAARHLVQRISPTGQLSLYTSGGQGVSADGTPRSQAMFDRVWDLTLDSNGALVVVMQGLSRIQKIASDVLRDVAGTSSSGQAGDGGPARQAQLNYPWAAAADKEGNLFIADTNNHKIRKVTPDGTIQTVAGRYPTPLNPPGGDGGPATNAYIPLPKGVAVDATGTLFVSDAMHRIRRVLPDGTIDTIAGTGVEGFSGDGGPALAAKLTAPTKVLATDDGTVLFVDQGNNKVRQLFPLVPVSLEKVDGDGQTAGAGKGFEKPLVVRAATADQIAVPNVALEAAVVEGSADVSSSAPKTGIEGTASIAVTPKAAGVISVVVRAPGLGEVTFSLTAQSAAVVPVPVIETQALGFAPGSMAVLRGANFAPAGTAKAVTEADLTEGAAPRQFGGTCVLVNGEAAPIAGLTDVSIAFQVPYAVAAGTATVEVVAGCGLPEERRSAAATATVADPMPVFINGADGAVQAGNVPGERNVRVFLTGIGTTDPAVETGKLVSDPVKAVLPVAVVLDGIELPVKSVLAAGLAPRAEGWPLINLLGLELLPLGVGYVEFILPEGAVPGSSILISVKVGGVETAAGAALRLGS